MPESGAMAWLLRGGQVLASVEIAEGLVARNRGLLGRSGTEGAMLLRHTNGVHSVGMRFAMDVAFLDRDLVVVEVVVVRPNRLALPRRRARNVLEAEAGAFERWGLKAGDQLEIEE
jgi:uncharacterized membrane protein (UPF0127 family)